MTSIRETVAENLSLLMQRTPHLGTQDKLARRSGIGGTTVGRIRRAQVDATIDTLNAIAQAFGVPVATFFALDESASTVSLAQEEPAPEGRVTVTLPLGSMTAMQLAVADAFSKVVGRNGLTDAECLALLNAWSDRLP